MGVNFAAGLVYEQAVVVGALTYYEMMAPNIVSQYGAQMGARNAGDVASGNMFPFEDAEFATGSFSSWQNSRFTAPESGVYFIGVHIMTDNAATGVTYWYLQKNGAASYWGTSYTSRNVARHYMIPGTFTVQMNANDYLEVYVASGTMYGASQAYCRAFGWKLDH